MAIPIRIRRVAESRCAHPRPDVPGPGKQQNPDREEIDGAKTVLGQPDFAYPSALQYKIHLGWAFKDPEHYGLQVHLDEKRLVREVKIVD